MKNMLRLASLATLLAVPGIAFSHHSAAPFDFSRNTTLSVTVKKFEVLNPHTHILVTVKDAKGTRDVDYEGHSASNFYRAGYSRNSIKAGDKISISFAPRRDGKDGGFLMAFTTPQGKKIGFGMP